MLTVKEEAKFKAFKKRLSNQIGIMFSGSGMDGQEIADRLKVTPNYIRYIQAGPDKTHRVPSVEVLFMIADICGKTCKITFEDK